MDNLRAKSFAEVDHLTWTNLGEKSEGMFPELGLAATYEMLAEEAMELAHAAQKCARLVRGDNPIRDLKDPGILREHVVEEFNDVLLSAAALGVRPDENILDHKVARFWIAMRNKDNKKSKND